jgi:CMP-N,N'-diacetyllegionaminic acid synthase
MINERSVLGVIAARGGSKGLPGKNVADLAGKPLVAWSVAAAHGSRHLDRVILSSDDADIIAAAREAGCEVPFVRPENLSGDEARIEDALIHALDNVAENFDYLVLLQATSPFRQAEDIDAAIACCARTGAPACVTVVDSGKSPYWMFQLGEDQRLAPVLPGGTKKHRQQLPRSYAPTGAVYVAEVSWFREHMTFYAAETVGQVMPPERSIDVDTPLDLKLARALCSIDGDTMNGIGSVPQQICP